MNTLNDRIAHILGQAVIERVAATAQCEMLQAEVARLQEELAKLQPKEGGEAIAPKSNGKGRPAQAEAVQ